MPTIISKPATPTFIVSTTTVDTPHPVTSAFGRTGDVLAAQGDYGIKEIGLFGALEITTLGFHEGEVIVVEGNKFELKPPAIGDEVIATSSIIDGDCIISDGVNWKNEPIVGRINPVIAIHAALTDGVHGLIDSGAGSLFLADDGTYKTIAHPPDVVTSVFGRAGTVVSAISDYSIAQITGLITVGAGTEFLADDGTYKPITHPAAPVASVFGRAGIVIAVTGDYTIPQITGLTDTGPGTNFLADDGVYKTITHPPDAIDSVFGRTGTVVAANNDYTLPQINGLIDSGAGTNFLADDGVYKTVPASGSTRVVVSASLADSVTITPTFQTIFDFAPPSNFRNQNVLITIHYQGHNILGSATHATHIRSLIGLTVQQNAYSACAVEDVNLDERIGFTVALEGIVSATGNIQIEVAAEDKDHDFSNNAANGKTRLIIELV